MHQVIHKYFALNKKVTLPGIGSFNAEMQGAKLDFINKTLQAPVPVIRYNPNDTADEQFYNFLSKETGLNESDVANSFNHFTSELKEQLETNHVLELKGIGSLIKNASGYSFDANNTVQDFFPDVLAERVIRQNAEHAVKVGEYHKTSTQMHRELQQKVVKKDNWFTTALILGAIGVAAIVLYYLINK
jgi:nucleoid DNA-binding protein